jgi:LacI family transcriptional regulator
MKGSNITMKDIAQALNVSIATVSRAMQDSYMISTETKQRILDYAEANNFRPNLSAQFLRSKQTRSIGISVSALNIRFYSDVLSGIESAASEKDYHIIISQCHESALKEQKNLSHLLWRGVDGLIVSLSSETVDSTVYNEIIESGVPIVFFDRVPYDLNAHMVISDNIGGSYRLTHEILARGYKKIAQITSQPYLSITLERLEGYRKALKEFDIPLRQEYIQHCMHGGKDKSEIEAALDALLNLPDPPEVVFTASDRITLECFAMLKQKGFNIPADMGIAGFSSFEFPELLNPSLTTVHQQPFTMGETAMQMLIKQIESKRPVSAFEKVVIPTKVEIRDSSPGVTMVG